MIRGVQSALAVRRQRSLRVQGPGGRRGSQFNSTSSLAGSDRRGSVLSTKVSNSSVTMFHIGIVFIVLGTILIITSLIPGHVRTDQWDDLFGTGCFLFMIGGALGLINRMVAKGEDEKLNSYVQRKLARSKSGLPAHPHHDEDVEGGHGGRHHRHGHHSKGAHHHRKGSTSKQGNKNGGKILGNRTKKTSIPASHSKQLSPTNNGEESAGAATNNGGPAKCSTDELTTKRSPSLQLHPIIEEQNTQQPKITVEVVENDGQKTSAKSNGEEDAVGVHQVRVEERPTSPTAGTPLLSDVATVDGSKSADEEEEGLSTAEDDETKPFKALKFKVPRQKSTS